MYVEGSISEKISMQIMHHLFKTKKCVRTSLLIHSQEKREQACLVKKNNI